MDTSSVGFRIPSFIDILTFLIFQLWPAAICVYLILYGLLKRFLQRIKHPLIGIFSIPLVIFLIFWIYELFVTFSEPDYFKSTVSGLFGFFVAISIISLCSVLPVTLLLFLLKKGRAIALLYIVMFVSLFLFFYPKSQLTFYDSNERMVPARECACLGISENNITEYYDRVEHRCFGIPISCKETTKDLCPFVMEGAPCRYYEYD